MLDLGQHQLIICLRLQILFIFGRFKPGIRVSQHRLQFLRLARQFIQVQRKLPLQPVSGLFIGLNRVLQPVPIIRQGAQELVSLADDIT